MRLERIQFQLEKELTVFFKSRIGNRPFFVQSLLLDDVCFQYYIEAKSFNNESVYANGYGKTSRASKYEIQIHFVFAHAAAPIS